MSTARYRAFIAVAQQGSLSAAARALGVSQPTVSSQIATLERQSQIELFHRQGYRMTLTGAGHKLMTLAQKLLVLEAETEFFLRDSGQLNQGELKIGAVGPFHVIEMVAAYSARHPGMKLSIRMGNSQQVLHDLENYTTDVAVLAGLYDRPELLAREYARHAIILFAHIDHPLARREQVELAQVVENTQRADLTDVELARRIQRLLDNTKIKKKDLAAKLDRKPSYISRLLAMLDAAWKPLVDEGIITSAGVLERFKALGDDDRAADPTGAPAATTAVGWMWLAGCCISRRRCAWCT